MTHTALNFTIPEAPSSPQSPPSAAPHNGLSTVELERFAQDYLRDCDYRMQAPRTIETRRIFIQNLLWFLHNRNFTVCAAQENMDQYNNKESRACGAGKGSCSKQCIDKLHSGKLKTFPFDPDTDKKWVLPSKPSFK